MRRRSRSDIRPLGAATTHSSSPSETQSPGRRLRSVRGASPDRIHTVIHSFDVAEDAPASGLRSFQRGVPHAATVGDDDHGSVLIPGACESPCGDSEGEDKTTVRAFGGNMHNLPVRVAGKKFGANGSPISAPQSPDQAPRKPGFSGSSARAAAEKTSPPSEVKAKASLQSPTGNGSSQGAEGMDAETHHELVLDGQDSAARTAHLHPPLQKTRRPKPDMLVVEESLDISAVSSPTSSLSRSGPALLRVSILLSGM